MKGTIRTVLAEFVYPAWQILTKLRGLSLIHFHDAWLGWLVPSWSGQAWSCVCIQRKGQSHSSLAMDAGPWVPGFFLCVGSHEVRGQFSSLIRWSQGTRENAEATEPLRSSIGSHIYITTFIAFTGQNKSHKYSWSKMSGMTPTSKECTYQDGKICGHIC